LQIWLKRWQILRGMKSGLFTLNGCGPRDFEFGIIVQWQHGGRDGSFCCSRVLLGVSDDSIRGRSYKVVLLHHIDLPMSELSMSWSILDWSAVASRSIKTPAPLRMCGLRGASR
jgi:hypothetical protein